MSSTLEDELASARSLAHAALKQKENELKAEESDIADSRVRYDAERLLEFYDEFHYVEVRAPCDREQPVQPGKESMRKRGRELFFLHRRKINDKANVLNAT